MEYEDRLRIATPEGVDVELTLAGIGSRFIAALLDLLIQGSVLLAAAFALGVLGSDDAGGYGVAIYSIVFFLVFFGYDVLFEVRSRGRTPGKRWTGLRVVLGGGRPITFVPSCVRNIMRVIDILPAIYGIGMLSIFVTSRNQRLGDLAAGTLVVRDRPGGLRERSGPARSSAVTRASDGWDVSAVSAQDVGTVRQFLDRRGGLETGARAELAGELERRLRPLVAGAPERPRGRGVPRAAGRREGGPRLALARREPVAARDLGEPARAVLRRALERLEVDVDQPEALAVAVAPLEVVHQRPHEVAAQVDAVGDRPVRGAEVAVEVRDPIRVGDAPVGRRPRRRRRRRSR